MPTTRRSPFLPTNLFTVAGIPQIGLNFMDNVFVTGPVFLIWKHREGDYEAPTLAQDT